MDQLFNPRSIVVVGASPDERKLPGRPLSYLRRHGFGGQVFAVNPKYSEIGPIRCFPTIAELPDGIDLALIMLPAADVPEALEALGRKGVAFAISVASGFAEAGNAAGQAALTGICRKYGIRLIGPNCVGFVNPSEGVTATFSTVIGREMPRPGGLAAVTQSGALGNALLQHCNDLGIGLRCWVSVGNEADLGALDFVRYLIDDPETSTIALFLEGLRDGDQLGDLAAQAHRRGKCIVVLRAGRSQIGREASISHTGKLAGSARVWSDLARSFGLVEVETLDELADMCLALQTLGIPRDIPAGIGVLTISGGLGVLISDHCAEHSVSVPRFADATQEALRALLPAQSSVMNPVDTALFANEAGYSACADAVIKDPSVGTLLLILTSLAHNYEAITNWLVRVSGELPTGKRIIVSFLSSADQLAPELRDGLHHAGILVIHDALRSIKVISRLDAIAKTIERAARTSATIPKPRPLPDLAPSTLLATAGIAEPTQLLCATAREAADAAAGIDGPVALKLVSPDIAHKTEVGGVVLGLKTPEEVEAAFAQMLVNVAEKAPAARIEGIAVQEMIPPGVELIVGCSVDAELGRVIMVGSGGIFAELHEDVTFRAVPLQRGDAREMLSRTKVQKLLDGYRGSEPADIDAACAAIERLSHVFAADHRLREVDLNPLIVLKSGSGARAVDCLVVAEDDA